MKNPFEIVGVPQEKGVLIAVDHASNHVPDDIQLGIDPRYMEDHIAYDIGAAAVARQMALRPGYLAILGGVSRLVVDLNRYADEPAVIPARSDGVEIPGNQISESQRQARLDRYFHPYHDRMTQLVTELQPSLALFLHSYTPRLRRESGKVRPWEVGVLYNEDDRASCLAMQFMEAEGLKVGDQQPYSGRDLHATMKRQAEDVGVHYTEVEIRQDLVAHEQGQKRFAEILLRVCEKIRTGLA